MPIDHDQICKTLVEHFLREFMELFCPEEAALMDFTRVEFIREELFTDLLRGDRRLLDLIAKVGLKVGDDRVVLVHFEFESQGRASDHPRRIFEYFCQLFLRHGVNVVAITVFTDDDNWKTPAPNFFELKLTDRSCVRLDFHVIHLKDFDYRKFLDSNNPLAYALMAKMNWSRRDIVRLKADFLRLIMGTGVDPARKSLLVDFVETYMPLVESQQQEFLTLVAQHEPYHEVEKMVTSYELAGIEKGRAEGLEQGLEQGLEKGLEKGLEQGREEGRLLAKQELLQRILQRRFGELPAKFTQAINEIADIAKLDQLIDDSLDLRQLSELSL